MLKVSRVLRIKSIAHIVLGIVLILEYPGPVFQFASSLASVIDDSNRAH